MLTGKKNLAKTSATPGKTQLINHFEITSTQASIHKKKGVSKWYLVDLPGYGYATVSQKARNNWENMIGSYIRKRENLVCLFVLIDSRHVLQKADEEFINQLGEWKVPFVIVFTKTDKNKPGVTSRHTKAILDKLLESWEELPAYFVTSAIQTKGAKEILDYIKGLNSRFSTV